MQFNFISVRSRLSIAVIFIGVWCSQASAEVEAPIALKTTASLEVGLFHQNLTANFPAWDGEFFRGVFYSDLDNVWNAEIVNAREFDDHGVLIVLGNTHNFNAQWYSALSISSSDGGLFLPRLRTDAAISRKWLDKLNLVTTVGISSIQAKDDHRDQSLLLSSTYYFDEPWVIEGGIRLNRSTPGDVASETKYLAVTYGRDKGQILSLRYGNGVEAYQVIGGGAQISNFKSDVWTATWRKWLLPNQGFQIRGESYINPSYERQGLEFSLFREF